MSQIIKTIDISYRGFLASCNYRCDYCPFALTHDDASQRKIDEQALKRFIIWIKSRQGKNRFRILLTPWGEALIRKWYRQAIIDLSWLPHVLKVVVQTNLSSPTHWLMATNRDKVALWTSFHPSEISLEKFITSTKKLDIMNINYSVGVVGKKESQTIVKKLRKKLNPNTYFWINAYKDISDYYSQTDQQFFTDIDGCN